MFKSALKEMHERHLQEEEELIKSCPHLKKYIKIELDHSYVGAGSCYPSVRVICRNCGELKVIFDLDSKKRKTVKKQIKKQGFKDERTDLYVQDDWELE